MGIDFTFNILLSSVLPSGPGGYDRMLVFIGGIVCIIVGLLVYICAAKKWEWLRVVSPRRGAALAEIAAERYSFDDGDDVAFNEPDEDDPENDQNTTAVIPARRKPTWESLGWDPDAFSAGRGSK